MSFSARALHYYRGLDPENRWVVSLLTLSFFVHITVLILGQFNLFKSQLPIMDEWQMEADLYVGDELLVPDKSALPKAEVAKEASIPETMLPQLSKKVAIEDQQQKPEVDADQGDLQKTDQKDEKIGEKSVLPKLANPSNEDANKISQEDALRRLALEKLRSEEKFSKKIQAEQVDAIARLKQDSAQDKKQAGGAGNIGLTGDQRNRYRSLLQAHVRRCYAIPTAYNLEKANLVAAIRIVLSENGDLVSAKVESTSGDVVFDDLAFKALKDCAPLPAPPKPLAGVPIVYQFKL